MYVRGKEMRSRDRPHAHTHTHARTRTRTRTHITNPIHSHVNVCARTPTRARTYGDTPTLKEVDGEGQSRAYVENGEESAVEEEEIEKLVIEVAYASAHPGLCACAGGCVGTRARGRVSGRVRVRGCLCLCAVCAYVTKWVVVHVGAHARVCVCV